MGVAVQSDALVQQLEHERDAKLTLINNYMQAAAEETRDLSKQEQETITAAQQRVRSINDQITLVSTDLALATDVTDRLRMLSPAFAGTQTLYRSTGQVLYDLLHQTEPDSKARYQRSMMRAAEHMGYEATTTTATAGDLGGLHISPVVGAVIDPIPGGMPLASAIGLIDAPNAMSFLRPKIVDPNFATGVAVQTLEKGELASKKFDVDATTVALATVGGYLNISMQLLSFQPGSLQLIVNHMNKRLGVAIDAALLAELDNSTGAQDLPAAGTAAQVLQALYDASAKVYTATGELATWIAMGPLGWARLGGLADAAGRPMFPYLGAANAMGTSGGVNQFAIGPAGLTPIVTPAITDASFWVGNSSCIEGYIYRYPLLEAVEPSVLGRQVAVAASFAGFRPITNGAVHVYDAP
jgi:HK97 family phage major capsid protein